MVRWLIILSSITMLLAGGSPTWAQLADDATILHYAGKRIMGGKWGIVGQFQTALDHELQSCGQSGITADGVFGQQSREAMRRLSRCNAFRHLAIGQGERHDGVVTERVWREVVGTASPSARERAFMAWLTHEATDYDRAEFNFTTNGNFQPNDPRSYLTWGPYGATVGHGREVQQILERTELMPAIDRCFAAEAEALQSLWTADDRKAGAIVQTVFIDSSRREIWRNGFRCLGAETEVRRAYEHFAFDSDRWLRPAIRRLYNIPLPPGQSHTEIDFAFFVDLAMHMTITADRINRAREAVTASESRLGRSLTPPEQRREIGQALVATLNNQIEDRRGRNVVYYINGVGADILSAEERQAWQQRSGFRAEQFGLADRPMNKP